MMCLVPDPSISITSTPYPILLRIAQVVPQRRYAEPEEVAGAAMFLLDDSKSSFVTGHILNVDGGFAAHGLLPKYP